LIKRKLPIKCEIKFHRFKTFIFPQFQARFFSSARFLKSRQNDRGYASRGCEARETKEQDEGQAGQAKQIAGLFHDD
jgi:hypothetical protein